jgi:hypothetical protein
VHRSIPQPSNASSIVPGMLVQEIRAIEGSRTGNENMWYGWYGVSSFLRSFSTEIMAEHLAYGYSAAQIVEHYPDLTFSQVHAALAYYDDHQDTVHAALLGNASGSPPLPLVP